MNFTEYRFDADYIKGRVADYRGALERREPGKRLEEKAAAVIWDRLLENPARYVEFGPWWWAVKRSLAQMGKPIGDDFDPVLFDAYRVVKADGMLDVAGCFAAGEEFRELYQGTFVRGTRTFYLSPDVPAYELVDDNLELALARMPARA
jgi:hypothetical protein